MTTCAWCDKEILGDTETIGNSPVHRECKEHLRDMSLLVIADALGITSNKIERARKILQEHDRDLLQMIE